MGNMWKAMITITLLAISCSGEKQNAGLAEYLRNQEHDPALVGWWQSVNDPDEYLCFDDADFRQIKARPANSTDAGETNFGSELVEYHWGWYWYTAGGVLYSVKCASNTTYMYEVGVEYRVSEDGQYLLEKDHSDAFITTWRRR